MDETQTQRYLVMVERVYGPALREAVAKVLEADPSLEVGQALSKAKKEVYGDQIAAADNFYHNVKIGDWEFRE